MPLQKSVSNKEIKKSGLWLHRQGSFFTAQHLKSLENQGKLCIKLSFDKCLKSKSKNGHENSIFRRLTLKAFASSQILLIVNSIYQQYCKIKYQHQTLQKKSCKVCCSPEIIEKAMQNQAFVSINRNFIFTVRGGAANNSFYIVVNKQLGIITE